MKYNPRSLHRMTLLLFGFGFSIAIAIMLFIFAYDYWHDYWIPILIIYLSSEPLIWMLSNYLTKAIVGKYLILYTKEPDELLTSIDSTLRKASYTLMSEGNTIRTYLRPNGKNKGSIRIVAHQILAYDKGGSIHTVYLKGRYSDGFSSNQIELLDKKSNSIEKEYKNEIEKKDKLEKEKNRQLKARKIEETTQKLDQLSQRYEKSKVHAFLQKSKLYHIVSLPIKYVISPLLLISTISLVYFLFHFLSFWVFFLVLNILQLIKWPGIGILIVLSPLVLQIFIYFLISLIGSIYELFAKSKQRRIIISILLNLFSNLVAVIGFTYWNLLSEHINIGYVAVTWIGFVIGSYKMYSAYEKSKPSPPQYS